MHDYAYSFNEPYTKNYYSHSAFDNYPVVGISWKQAVAFTKWRTLMINKFRKASKQPILPDFRLPTESEWEYASRGGLDLSPYPWGGPYTRNNKGCFLANFKPLRGNYTADGGIKSIKVGSYNPNGYGLFDMAGNVSEWTSNAFDESAFSYSHDMNMDYHYNATDDDHQVLKRKVTRGGSWKDIAYFIQNSTRSFEYQDTAKSFIGFRCAIDFLGRDKKDFQ
jgi:gliding motility-associated lipoprotein GldK